MAKVHDKDGGLEEDDLAANYDLSEVEDDKVVGWCLRRCLVMLSYHHVIPIRILYLTKLLLRRNRASVQEF